MQNDLNKQIEDNFGHQKTNYSYKYNWGNSTNRVMN